MPSPFAAAMAAADAVIGSTFGEDIRITPMCPASGELKAASVDSQRPMRTVTGVFTLHGATDRLGGTRQGTELQGMSSLAVAPATVWFSAETLASLPFEIVPGDRITRIEEPGEPWFEVARRAPSDLSDATFFLTKA